MAQYKDTKLSQSSGQHEPQPGPRSLSLIRPWFFKPKKSKFQLKSDHRGVKKFNSRHWSQLENRKYVDFLTSFLDLMKSGINEKRKFHLNRMMSKHIGTRSDAQCRSHHQKMIKAFKTNQAIIAHFVNQGPSNQDQHRQESIQQERPREIMSNLEIQENQERRIAEEDQSRRNILQGLERQHNSERLENSYQEGQREIQIWDILTFPPMQSNYFDYL